MTETLAPVHPGEILKEDFLTPMGISEYALAKQMKVPPRRINEITHGKRAITIDTALRLGRAFDMEWQFWANLQSHYDKEIAMEIKADDYAGIEPLLPFIAQQKPQRTGV